MNGDGKRGGRISCGVFSGNGDLFDIDLGSWVIVVEKVSIGALVVVKSGDEVVRGVGIGGDVGDGDGDGVGIGGVGVI